jgi:hypothetical protein
MIIENKKNDKSLAKRNSSMNSWKKYVFYFEKHFLKVAEDARISNYFDRFYVSKEKDERQIQLFSGVHPIGPQEIKRNEIGEILSSKLHSESGATLVISQAATGNVTIILYPYKSEKATRVENQIIWGVFESPVEINEKILNICVKDFFTYSRLSSVLHMESFMDRFRIGYLIQRSKKFSGGSNLYQILFSKWVIPVIGLLGVFVGIASGLKSLL